LDHDVAQDPCLPHLGIAKLLSPGLCRLCEIAALTILAAIITNKISAWEAWAALFFAIVGGIAWLAGRTAKWVLAGI
jgi:hypothetical protein